MEYTQNNEAEEDVYAVFEPESDGNFAPQGSFGAAIPPPSSGTGANPLMHAPPSKWGATSMGSAWGVPGSRLGTMGGGMTSTRPMTSNRGVGFNATASKFNNGAMFDPAGQSRVNMAMGPAPPLKKRGENSPEEQCAEIERSVHKLIEESAMLAVQGDFGAALEKAKDASKRERYLCKQREQLGLADQINADLTYAVHFNLAVQYQNHQLYTEALNTYNLIVRNSQFPQAPRLRVNMGNIYAAQGKYLLAIKMYRTTLDETPTASKESRYKLMRNIGNAFVKLGQYRDAVGSYEAIMEGGGDISAGFNLLLCYYALGEPEKMKRAFQSMLNCKAPGIEDDEEEDENEKKDVLVDDALRKKIKETRSHFTNCIMTAARLIAPAIDKDWRIGYDFLIERLRQYEMRDSSSLAASELEMCKALNYLKHKRYKEAIDGLKAFEKKDKLLRARAATNLAYLYFLEGDHDNGEKYSDMSLEANGYNARALVNKGNFFFMNNDFEKARQYYNDALAIEADNIEAIYNIGLTAKRLGLYEEALKMFKRVQSLVDSHEVMYQIADINDLVNNPNTSEWFNRLIGRVPTDPNILARMGAIYAREGDDSQAFHYYLEAYRYYQVNMDVISWLGAYFVKNEVYDKSIQFFERASQIQPHEVKWDLMVASCHRRRGDYIQAIRLYEAAHRKYPENMECLRYLVQLCKDNGLIEDANEWFKKIKKLEQRQIDEADGSGRDEGETDGDRNAAAAGRRAAGGAGRGAESPIAVTEKDDEAPTAKTKGVRRAQDDDDDILLPGRAAQGVELKGMKSHAGRNFFDVVFLWTEMGDTNYTNFTDADGEAVVVFTSFQTLLSVEDAQHFEEPKRRVPAEGYYVVMSHPWEPRGKRAVLYDGGFVHQVDEKCFLQTSIAKKEYMLRVAGRHGIAAHTKDFKELIKKDSIKKAFRYFEEARNSSAKGQLILASYEEKEKLTEQLGDVFAVVEQFQHRVGASGRKILFVTIQSRLQMTRAALLWFGQNGMKLPPYAVVAMEELIPASEEFMNQAEKIQENSAYRCAVHLPGYINEYGKLFDCCKADVALLRVIAERLADYLAGQDTGEDFIVQNRAFEENEDDDS